MELITKIQKNALFVLALIAILFAPQKAFAQTLNNPLSGIGVNSIGDLFTWVITTLLAFAGVAAVFVIIWAGYTLIFSGGNKDKVTQAKQRLLWALAGLVLIILSGFLVRIVLSIIN